MGNFENNWLYVSRKPNLNVPLAAILSPITLLLYTWSDVASVSEIWIHILYLRCDSKKVEKYCEAAPPTAGRPRVFIYSINFFYS